MYENIKSARIYNTILHDTDESFKKKKKSYSRNIVSLNIIIYFSCLKQNTCSKITQDPSPPTPPPPPPRKPSFPRDFYPLTRKVYVIYVIQTDNVVIETISFCNTNV